MARPLKESKIKKMDLTVKLFNGESKKLGKQIGFNRYVVDDETKEIATLSQELKKEGDALLTLEDHGKDKSVIKIVENLFQTSDKPYAYVLDADGKVVFLEEGVSVYDTNPDVENAEQALEEIANVPAGGKGGADVEGSAEFTSSDKLNIDENKDITLNVEDTLTLDTNSASVSEGSTLSVSTKTANLDNNAFINNGTATLSISEGGEFSSDAIITSGDNAETTIQGGK